MISDSTTNLRKKNFCLYQCHEIWEIHLIKECAQKVIFEKKLSKSQPIYSNLKRFGTYT